jgi:DNA-directed RNA polymerase specialized sigma24 family protein
MRQDGYDFLRLSKGIPMQGADLYDTHAIRLYSYCWSLVGNDAAHALREAFVAAAKQGVTDPLRLYELARRSCVRRGALDPVIGPTPGDDPLLRAAARLRPDHREALALSVEFEPAEIGELLGLAPDTVHQMIATARARLERAVLDACWPGPVPARYEDVLAAFERRQLVHLLSLRSGPPPHDLRQTAVSAWEAEKLPHTMAEAQLVELNTADKPVRRGRRRALQTLTTVATVAAAVSGAVFFTGDTHGTPAGVFTSIIPSSWSSSTNSSKPKKTPVYPAGTKLDPVTQEPVIGTLVPTAKPSSVSPLAIPPVPSSTPTKSTTPTKTPTKTPTTTPTAEPTDTPTATPTDSPTGSPTDSPTPDPTDTGRPQD